VNRGRIRANREGIAGKYENDCISHIEKPNCEARDEATESRVWEP